MRRWSFCFGLFLLLYPSGVLAEELRVGPVYTEKLPTLEVVIETPKTVEAPASQLTPSDLTLIEDGQATVTASGIQPFRNTQRGLAMVLALDVSGTMSGQPIGEMKRALATFISKVGTQDRVALVTIAEDYNLEAGFGASPDDLRAAADRLRVRGDITELYKGLFKALSLFDAPALPARQRLVVISDGKDEGTAYKLDDVIERAKARGVPVDAVGLTRIDPKYLSALERLALLSGGHYERAARAEQLEALLSKSIAWLQATPVASFTPQRLQPDNQAHHVGVRLHLGGHLLEGETRLVLSPAPSPPKPEPVPPSKPTVPLWVWLAGGGLLLGLILLFAVKARKRPQRSRFPKPPPKPKPAIIPPEPVILSTNQEPSNAGEAPFEVAPQGELREQAGALSFSADKPPLESASRAKTKFRIEFPPPDPGKPSAVLVAQEGPIAGTSAPIEVEPFWIGSEEGNSLCIPEDPYLSSHHACIRFHNGTLLLYDYRSTNGTFLNGERLDETPRPLSPGDHLKVGKSVLEVQTSSES